MAQLVLAPNLENRRQRLFFSRNQFDDYIIALNAQIRTNEMADRVLQGTLRHPLELYQRLCARSLTVMGIPIIPTRYLVEDPIGTYDHFNATITNEYACANTERG